MDKFGDILVTGWTNSGNFPLVSPLQANLDNFQNAFVAKLSSNPPTLLYSTYFSGDGAAGIAVDDAGDATIVGRFFSPNPGGSGLFPLVYNLPSLVVNGYAAQIDPTGTTLLYSTFVSDITNPGLPLFSYPSAVAVDGAGNAYVAGFGFYVAKLISQPGVALYSLHSSNSSVISCDGRNGSNHHFLPSGRLRPDSGFKHGRSHALAKILPRVFRRTGVLKAIGFSVDANTGGPRQASLLINGTGITISQAGSVPPPPSLGLIGFWDAPVTSMNASGEVAISGWALSSNPISVQIYRNAVPGEHSPNGLIFIGNGTFVAGSRPDVAAQHAEYSSNNNAGWSYALLTNTLPNSDGSRKRNGTYQLTVILQDSTNQITFPARAMVVSNKNVPEPFGTIDTPAPGAVVSGNSHINFGWALTPQPFMIPLNGSTINVFLDGRPSGTLASYNNFRPDVAAVLPGYQNSNGAVGFETLDTTTLTTGQHSISWGITDNNNQTASAGNRIFTVLDGTAIAAPLGNRAELMLRHTEPVTKPGLRFSGQVVLRKGYDLNAPLEQVNPDKTWTYQIAIQQLDRLELHLLIIIRILWVVPAVFHCRWDRHSMRRSVHFTGRSTPAS